MSKESLGCLGTVIAAIVGGICLIITALPSLLPMFRPSATATQALIAGAPAVDARPVAGGAATLLVDSQSSPAALFPDAGDINSDWKPTQVDTPTNEDIAKQFDDPGSALLLINSWGRVSGRHVEYSHDAPCDFNGVRFLDISVAIYQSADGAHNAMKYFADAPASDRTARIALSDVADEAYLSWFEYPDDCQPPDDMRSVSISFRRYNVYGIVYIEDLKGAVTDDRLLDDVRFLARRIDLKVIASAAKK